MARLFKKGSKLRCIRCGRLVYIFTRDVHSSEPALSEQIKYADGTPVPYQARIACKYCCSDEPIVQKVENIPPGRLVFGYVWED